MIARRPNFYTAAGLDRVGHLRRDQAWLAARLDHEATRFVPVWRSQNLVREAAEGPRPILLDQTQARAALAEGEPAALLGVDGDIVYFALDLSTSERPLDALALADEAAQASLKFQDLRAVGPLLPQREGALLAYARGLMHWHSRHRFCGVCGSPTVPAEAGHVRTCTDPACRTTHFPRTDPAVIMLVHTGDECLLGRQPQWPPGMYSTLAGFVEPGESLEEAVQREVLEEAGILVETVEYHSSQPWPFPGSIMLGFWASAATREIRIDGSELEDARWVSRDWLLEHEDDQHFRMPRLDSIARRLIEDWLNRD